MATTEKLATFVRETKLKEMPTDVVGLTKRAIIDTLGVALVGSAHPATEVVVNFVAESGCRPTTSIIGHNLRTTSPLAALANGFIAHVLDYDDTHDATQGHPSAVLVPVLLSLGEELGASGEDAIEAYVLGLETWAKISSVMPELHLKGWHPSGILGTVGAAAAAAKLLKLTTEEIIASLGIASSLAAGLIKNFGTPTKPLHIGNAAKNGIVAALLAKKGLTATRDILDGDMNFPLTFYGEDVSDTSKISENLGSPFALISPGLNVKKYPSCYDNHRALDALFHLIELYDISPEDVESITCYSNPVAVKNLRYTHPKTALESKFSMQFAMAVALMDREFGLDQVTNEKVNDHAIKNLMKKVALLVHPDWTEGKDNARNRADIVVVRVKGGQEYRHEVLVANGSSRLPLTDQTLLKKYRECAKLVLNKEQIERCIGLIWKLERIDDMREISQAVAMAAK